MSAPHAFLRVGRSPNAPRVVSAFAPSATAAAAASADASALNANNLNNDAASSFDTSVASPIARLDAEFNSSALPDSFPPDAVVSPILPTSSLDASMNTVVAAPAAVAVADEDSTLAPISPARLARQRAMAARAAGGSGLVSRYNTAPQSAFASRAHVNANGASSNAHSGADAAATSAGNGAGAGAQSKYATLGGLGSPTAKFTRRPPTTATSVPAVNGSNSNANENVSVSVNAGGSSVRSSYSPSRTSLGQALGLSNPAATANNNSSNNSNTVNASKTVTGSGFRLVMSDNSNNSSASNTANGANVADSAADTSIVSTNSDDSNLSADDDLLATYTVGLGKTASKYPAGANTGTNASSANKDITKSAAATVASEPEAAESAGAVDAWWVALADTERPLPRSSSSSSPLNASPVPSADHGSAAAAAGAGAGAGVGTAVHEYDGTGSESDGDGDGARGGRGTKCKRRVSWGNERVIELPSSKQPSAHNTTAVAEPEADADAVGEDNADTVDMSAWDDVPYRPGSGPSVTSVASAPTSSSAGSLGNGASCAGLHTECEGDSAVASVTTPTNSAAIGATGTSGGAVADATVSRLLSSPESLAGNSPTAASNTAASNAAAAAAAAAAAVTANGIPAELGIDSVYSAAENASGDFATDNTAAAAANDAVLSTPPKASSSNGTPRGSSSGGGGGDLEDEDDTLADLPSATTLFTPNASRGTYTAEDRLNGHSFGSGHSRSHSESETDHGADDGSRSAAQTPGRKSLGQESSESSTPQMQQQQQQQQRQQGTHTPGPYAAETPSPAAVLRRWEGPQLQLTPPTPSTTSSYASSSSSSVPGSAVSASTAPAASAVTAGSAGPIAAVVQGYGYGFLGSDATTNAASASAAFAPDINAAANAAATSAAGAALHRETSDLYASPARAAAPASLAPGTGAAAHRSHSGDGTGNGKAMTPLRSPLPGLPAPDAFSPANRNSSSSAGDGVCIVDGMPSLLSPSGAGASGRPNFGAAQCSDWSPAPNPSNHPISRLLRDGAGGGGGVATMDSVDADRDVEAEAAKGGAHAKSGFVAANNISAASASNGGAFTGFTAPPPPVPVRNAVNASANNVSISGFVAAPSATETVAAPAAAAAAACPLSPLPQPTVPMSPPSRAPVPLFSPPTTSNSNTHSHNQGQGNNATRASLTGFAPVAANNSTAASEHASASKAAAAVVASGGASAAVPSSPLPTLPAPASVSLFASPRRHVDDGKAFFGTAAASGAPAAAAHDGAGLAALSAFNKPHHNANAGAASESANAAPEADPCTPPRPSRMNSANNTHAAAASGAAGCDGSVGAGAALLSPTSRLPGTSFAKVCVDIDHQSLRQSLLFHAICKLNCHFYEILFNVEPISLRVYTLPFCYFHLQASRPRTCPAPPAVCSHSLRITLAAVTTPLLPLRRATATLALRRPSRPAGSMLTTTSTTTTPVASMPSPTCVHRCLPLPVPRCLHPTPPTAPPTPRRARPTPRRALAAALTLSRSPLPAATATATVKLALLLLLAVCQCRRRARCRVCPRPRCRCLRRPRGPCCCSRSRSITTAMAATATARTGRWPTATPA